MKQPVLDYEGQPLLADKTNPDGTPVLDEQNRPVKQPETLRTYLVNGLNLKSRSEVEPNVAAATTENQVHVCPERRVGAM